MAFHFFVKWLLWKNDDIDLPVEGFFDSLVRLPYGISIGVKEFWMFKVYVNIDVALFCFFSSCVRAE
jgi:hypothetical protein